MNFVSENTEVNISLRLKDENTNSRQTVKAKSQLYCICLYRHYNTHRHKALYETAFIEALSPSPILGFHLVIYF